MTARRTWLGAAAALAVAAVAAPSAHAAQWKTITVATEGAYEPWNMTKPDGSLAGFEIDLLKNLCGHMHLHCKVITQDWDGSIPALQAGKFDVLMDAVSITPEREKAIAFSRPYAATPASFAAVKGGALARLPGSDTTIRLTGDEAKDRPKIAKLRAALKGKVIGIQTATVYTSFIENEFKDVATIREFKTAAEHDLDLNAGRIDVAFDDATYFTSAFAKPDNADLTLTGPKIAGPIWGPGEGFGFRKNETALIAKFNKAIGAALADGTIKKLSLKWFKLDVAPE